MKAPRPVPGALGKGRAVKDGTQKQGRRPSVACWAGLARVLASLCFLAPNPLPSYAADASSSQDRRPVMFGPAKGVAELQVEQSCFNVRPQAVEVKTQTLTFQQDESACFIYPAPEGYDYLAVGELQPGTEPARPQLPMKTFELNR